MKRAICILTALTMTVLFLFTGCASKTAAVTLTAQEILSKSYDSMSAVKSFHFILDHTGGGTAVTPVITMTKAEGDVVKPDKLKTTISGTAAGASVEVTLITADGKTMITNPLNGKWEELSGMFEVLSVFDPSTGIASIINGITNPTSLADEKVGSGLCYHLKGEIASQVLKPITGTTATDVPISVEVWIDQTGFLVQQVKLSGKIIDNEADGIVRTLTFSNYNKDVDISLPE
jgi:hypothetical protein